MEIIFHKSSILNSQEMRWFNILDSLSYAEKDILFKKTILPQMEVRRNRIQPLSTKEIHDKIYALEPKPGEYHELIEAIRTHPSGIDSKIASELADIYYYTSMPKAGPELAPQKVLKNIISEYFDGLYATFAIIKYSTRLATSPTVTNYKEKEYVNLNLYLAKHPEYRYMWSDVNIFKIETFIF